MPNMPLDVLFEIFRFLHPRDLLNLARTTKDFRALLMRRSSASFWATSRKQIQELPEIPENLSEPAYANLLFYNHCHRCLRTGLHVSAYWDIQARYCSGCRDIMITSSCTNDELIAMVEDCELTDLSDIVTPIYVRSADGYGYHFPELEEVKSVCVTLKKKEDKIEYIRERQQVVRQRQSHARELSVWEDLVKQNAIEEEAAVVAERREAIWAKLRDAGWGEDLDRLSSTDRTALSNMNVVCRPSKLTNRSWSLSRAAITGFMEDVRAKRLKAEQTARFTAHFEMLSSVLSEYQHKKWLEDRQGYIFLSFADCVMAEDFRAIIEDTSGDHTEEYVKAKFTDLVPAFASRWIDERRVEFTALLRKELGEEATAARTADPLSLAIAWFNCTSENKGCCSELVGPHWPGILDHGHFRRGHPPQVANDPYTDTLASFLRNVSRMNSTWETEYDGRHSCVDKRLPHIRDVITACGEDPDTATKAQMDASNAHLVCRLCATLVKREVFDWKAAIAHDFDKHYPSMADRTKPLAGRWMRIPDEYAAVAKSLEDALLDKPAGRYTTFRCAWCAQYGFVDQLNWHIQSRHGKASPRLDEDFFILRRERTIIWMLSDLLSSLVPRKLLCRRVLPSLR
ncbi:hypothetical protein C8T65DRAFT_809895, partial [Cerioporus squamosus]